MRTFDFYEFVGVLAPGTIAMFLATLLFGQTIGEDPVPQNLGGLGIYIIIAYVIGHLVQALARGVEVVYWHLWKGMPTDWPVTRPQWAAGRGAISSICRMTGKTHPGANKQGDQLGDWHAMVRQARSTLYAIGRASRVQVFNGNYGMFRGLLTVLMVAAVTAWWTTEVDPAVAFLTLLGLAFLAERRMHRFAIHYATELFANAAAVAETQPLLLAGNGGQRGQSEPASTEKAGDPPSEQWEVPRP